MLVVAALCGSALCQDLRHAEQPLEQPASAVPEPAPLEQRVAALETELQRQADEAVRRAEDDDAQPSFHVGGQLQADYLWFGQDAENRATVGDVPDAIDFRRARLVGRGEAFDQLEFMLGFDFALSGRPSFLDVWVGAKDLPYVGRARVGHFFEPFSLERNTHNPSVTFMERALADAFAPSRNLGMEIHDSLGEEERATYAVGWFAANSDNFGEQFANAGGQALTARATWLPIWAADGRAYMHLGAAYSYRTPPDQVLRFSSHPEARSGGSDDIPPFVDTGDIAAEHNQLFGVEWAFVYGGLYVQSEYIAVPVNQVAGPDLFFDGAYLNVSYFLTGESRTYNKLFGIIDRVFPFENFFRVRTEDGSVATGWGAWEIAARASYINLTDANIQGGRLHDYTIGLNWYLNAYTRVKWELIQANLDRVPVGESQAYVAGMRFDIDF
jgi:phosphate-selective porin OprO/OprP